MIRSRSSAISHSGLSLAARQLQAPSHRLNFRPPIFPSGPARTLVRFNSQLPPNPPSSPPPSSLPPPPPPPPSSGPSSGQNHHHENTYSGSSSTPSFPWASADALDKFKSAAKTPTKWYPIPIALGAIVLLAVQFRKQLGGPGSEGLVVTSQGEEGAVLKRNVDGPWQVRVMGALPLRSLSQLWGYLNGLVLPVWFRPYGFRLYSYIFGCNLDEVPRDLASYESLGDFFYREIREGSRPISEAPMVSPADGRVLHFGEITGERVEQVKGITYSLGALLGQDGEAVGEKSEVVRSGDAGVQFVDDENFATINDIPYSIDKLMGSGRETKEERVTRKKWRKWGIGGEGWKFWKRIGGRSKNDGVSAEEAVKAIKADAEAGGEIYPPRRWWRFWRRYPGGPKAAAAEDDSAEDLSPEATLVAEEMDASHHTGRDMLHDVSVAQSLGSSAIGRVTERGRDLKLINPNNKLYFMVVYLAPGDYHRFHSPTNWVVERRRHFTGDLFSVSPYIANRLSNLFVLNERVALLGRWKHGFYSMVPVGATNVGSIVINFDGDLRTNTRKLSHPAHTFTEAVYTSASKILQGQPLLSGEEMGGFKLGSTIVMVFEAPKNWKFSVNAGEKVQVGQELGRLVDKQ